MALGPHKAERRCLRPPAMEPPAPPQEQPPRPRSHTVTTTSSSFTANLSGSSSTLAYDREFLRTVPGLLMVTEIVSDPGRGARRGGQRWGEGLGRSPAGHHPGRLPRVRARRWNAGKGRARGSKGGSAAGTRTSRLETIDSWKSSAGHTRSAQPPVVSAVSTHPAAERRVLADRDLSFGDSSVTTVVVYALHFIAHE